MEPKDEGDPGGIYDNPDPCVSVLVTDDEDRVLLGLRGQSSIKPGLWCLPCGYIEGHETIEDAAKREVKEETGIYIELLDIVNVVSNHFGEDYTSLVIVLLARPLTYGLTAGDDIVRAGWFDITNLPEMAFKADLHIIGRYRSMGRDFGIPFADTCIEFSEDRG